MAEDHLDEETNRVTVTLEQHRRMLSEFADTLDSHLQLHTVRHQALYAAATEIVAIDTTVPPAIVEKVIRGGRYGDMDSFNAEQRAWRARELSNSIASELNDAQQSPRSELVLHQLRCLDKLAQLECERDGHALEQLLTRIEFLEKWILMLSGPQLPPNDHSLQH